MTDNSKHLIAHKKNESVKKIEAVREAVSYMLYSSEEINLNKVAKKARVSRTFIYSNKELRELIDSSREPSKVKAERKRISSGQARSDESKLAIINNLKRRLSELTKELDRVKSDNAKLRSYISEIED
ncbi:DUF6262 family protein [Bermanella sp. WJH001]|jgi:small-conductance mechanosensitive channel|uniref:DUF6262 family protein n=1 Tax=Bermanella sp. WJH001 TaxID=3048005 RepID=UPI0024BEC5C1|nr:DUF6262 family protein [Bermanella sp. WJH001]MDJ1537041.1 DUF6262 family protein [Bermanella sp. WJH001]|tara:strand:- start:1343 stop:1726 length:384 start_codon:yes stop_codon:yes gene_type:complete